MPKVSVIVPCYNVAPYVARCLDSLTNQTLDDIEFICIDDKSTDNTLEILQKYAKQDKRITVIASEKNSGVATTRNKGLEIASGEYIGFVDPDDYIDLDFYEKLYNCAVETDAIVIKASVINTDMTTGETALHWGVNVVKKHIAYFSSAFWSAIYRHDFLKKHNIKFPDGLLTAEDAVFLTHVGTTTQDIAFVDDTSYHYFYKRPGSLDSEFLTHKKAQSGLTAIKTNLKLIENANLGKSDFTKHMEFHVLGHIYHEINKKFENDDDRQKFFLLVVELYNKYEMLQSYIINRFSRRTTKLIQKNDYKNYVRFICRGKKRYYLFGLIPFIKIERYVESEYFSLFDFIPLMKIYKGRKYYLFNCLLIIKTKG